MRYLARRIIIVVAVAGVSPAVIAAAPDRPAGPHPLAASLKKYKATITRKDARGNTKTFTDYCEATSYFEAQKTFEGRYPDGKVGAITEVK